MSTFQRGANSEGLLEIVVGRISVELLSVFHNPDALTLFQQTSFSGKARYSKVWLRVLDSKTLKNFILRRSST